MNEQTNRAIAEFMGATPCELQCKGSCGSYLIPQLKRHFTPNDMKYDTSWDWLMGPWAKLYPELMPIKNTELIDEFKSAVVESDINLAYIVVVKGVKLLKNE